MGRSWLDRLSTADQLARWGRVQIQGVEDEVRLPGANLVSLTALADVPLPGSGRLAAGEKIVLTKDLREQLIWLSRETQLSAYGFVAFSVEPDDDVEDSA